MNRNYVSNSTKKAHAAILHDIADVSRNITKDIIADGEMDGTNSQEVLDFAIDVWKAGK